MTERAGLLLVNKPAGLTSHQVVAQVRRLLGTRKVGHCGTLDPAATGVLVLGINRGTKLLHFLFGATKQYRATIRLGATTSTDDAEGEMLDRTDASRLTADHVNQTLGEFRGQIMQVPSSVSAIKIRGERAYDLVRRGQNVQMSARPVTISRLEIEGCPRVTDQYFDVDVVVDCSSGTYIRALARDLGQKLGVGGHLIRLERTRLGPWYLNQTVSLDETSSSSVLPLAEVLADLFPVADVEAPAAERFRYGQAPPIDAVSPLTGVEDGSLVALRSKADDGPVVVGLVRRTGTELKTEFVADPA